eukprot:Trichotokara_eunicae@DN5968_c0_g1_i5.p1
MRRSLCFFLWTLSDAQPASLLDTNEPPYSVLNFQIELPTPNQLIEIQKAEERKAEIRLLDNLAINARTTDGRFKQLAYRSRKSTQKNGALIDKTTANGWQKFTLESSSERRMNNFPKK